MTRPGHLKEVDDILEKIFRKFPGKIFTVDMVDEYIKNYYVNHYHITPDMVHNSAERLVDEGLLDVTYWGRVGSYILRRTPERKEPPINTGSWGSRTQLL